MDESRGELLDLRSPRYWSQNAQLSIRDLYDAIVEIVTNADDRYSQLKAKRGIIQIEVERRRKGTPSIVRIRDYADGMTMQDMLKKIKKVGRRVSGMAEGESVRGTYSRGAKDVAVLGGVTFESFAGDGCYHKCEITAQGRFISHGTVSQGLGKLRKQVGISEGTGTLVTMLMDSGMTQVPLHESLVEGLSKLVPIRDILKSAEREITLFDSNQTRSEIIRAPFFEGSELVNERFVVPGYKEAEAKLVINRSKSPLPFDKNKFRLSGVLIRSRRAVHEATLCASELENDPHARWFYGTLTCPYIDDLSDAHDDRFERGLPPVPENPRQIIDPLRKEGLSREHPFTEALLKEILKRLRPLVEQERKQAEKKQAQIESDHTRKRLRALEKIAAKFMSDYHLENDDNRETDELISDSTFERKGFSFSPPFAQLVVGSSCRFWLHIRQESFPEFSVGDVVQISCASTEISASKQIDGLEQHTTRAGVLVSSWSVKAESATKATAVKVRVGDLVAESAVEVLGDESEKYKHVTDLMFQRKRYAVKSGTKRNVVLMAPSPSLIATPSKFELIGVDGKFAVSGERLLVPNKVLGIAQCRLRIGAESANRSMVLKAIYKDRIAETQVISTEPLGATISIELKDTDYTNQRYYWKGNTLEIGARHASLRRYLGPAPDFPGQEEKHFRVLLAEIVAEAVCSRLLADKVTNSPEDYADSDWDRYYSEYSGLLAKFLPMAHDTQLSI